MPAIAFYIIRTIFLAVAVTQLLATIHIYSTNLALFARINELAAWYLTVPNQPTALALQQPASAFFAATFFSVTIGPCMALLFLMAMLADNLFIRYRRYVLSISALVWLVITLHAGSFTVAVYLWVVPASLLIHHHYWSPLRKGMSASHAGLTAALIASAFFPLLISSTLDKNTFMQGRDAMLFETALGRAINDFYYRYTLFAAEAIKPIHQHNMKTVLIDGTGDVELRESIARSLLQAGYLPLSSHVEADIVIRSDHDVLTLQMVSNAGEQSVSSAEFQSDPRRVLAEFSAKFDSRQALRSLLRYSIIFAVPIAASLLLSALCVLLAGSLFRFIGRRLPWCREYFHAPYTRVSYSHAPWLAGLLMYVLILLSTTAAIKQPTILITTSNLAARLASDDWQERVAALQYAYQNQIDIKLYQSDPNGVSRILYIINSIHIAERYWYGMALSFSSADSAADNLQQLLHDGQINVVCAALNAIGRRGENNFIAPVKNLLLNSEHWYVQWYAYTALQQMGWLNNRAKDSALEPARF